MIASLCTFVLALAPQGGGDLTAAVNDSNSPGAVGDALLSLEEAICLANGTLELNQLSAGEKARVSGTGSVVNQINLDAAVTRFIMLDAELSAVIGQGTVVAIEAVSSSKPVLLGGSVESVLTLSTHLARVRGLVLEGGQFGVTVQHSDGSMGSPAELHELELRGQSVAGFRFSAAGNPEGQTTAVLVNGAKLSDMSIGYRLFDTSRSGGLIVVSENVELLRIGTGIELNTFSQSGTSVLELNRVRSRQCETLLRVRRTPDSTQVLNISFTHGDHVVTGDVMDIQGSDQGLTAVHHHHSVFRAGEGGKAFWVYPRTARFDVHGSEVTFEGDVSIAAGEFSPRIFQRNCLYLDGSFFIDNSGGQPTLDLNRYENVSLATLVDNQVVVSVTTSEFHDSDVVGISMDGGIVLDNCYLAATGIAGDVQVQNAAPSPWIGLTTVEPNNPSLGDTLRFHSTLPMGIAAVWHVGLALTRPAVEDFPFVIYADIATLIPLPSVLIESNTLALAIPVLAELAGLEFHAQAVAFPYLGQQHVPPVHLPIGALILIRM